MRKIGLLLVLCCACGGPSNDEDSSSPGPTSEENKRVEDLPADFSDLNGKYVRKDGTVMFLIQDRRLLGFQGEDYKIYSVNDLENLTELYIGSRRWIVLEHAAAGTFTVHGEVVTLITD